MGHYRRKRDRATKNCATKKSNRSQRETELEQKAIELHAAKVELINEQNALRIASEAFERQLPKEMEALRSDLKISQYANCNLRAENDNYLYALRNSSEDFHAQREIIKDLTQQKDKLEEILDQQIDQLQNLKVVFLREHWERINQQLHLLEEQSADLVLFHQAIDEAQTLPSLDINDVLSE
jgi:hypothetical protein